MTDNPLDKLSNRQYQHLMSTAGAGQHAINVEKLTVAVNEVNAKLMQYAQPGETMEQLQARFVADPRNYAGPPTAALNAAISAQTSLHHEIRMNEDDASGAAEARRVQQRDSRMLKDSRDTDLALAVTQMERDHGVSRDKAFDLVTLKIQTDGEAAVLPRYTSVKNRMAETYPELRSDVGGDGGDEAA